MEKEKLDFFSKLFETRNFEILDDGIYELTPETKIINIALDFRTIKQGVPWIIENGLSYIKQSFCLDDFKNKVYIANPYETGRTLILSEKPQKFTGKVTGEATYGANMLLEDCPKRILILYEND